jgi:hypothetical protein
VTGSAIAQRGETFPGFTLPDGFDVLLESYRGRRNLVVVFAADVLGESPVTAFVQELLSRSEDLPAEAAQVLVIVTSPHIAAPRAPTGFPTLLDVGGYIHRAVGATDAVGRPAPAVFVTDRFREIFAAYLPARGHGLPSVKEILEWLVFINIQCPECGVPEWAP